MTLCLTEYLMTFETEADFIQDVKRNCASITEIQCIWSTHNQIFIALKHTTFKTLQ